MIQNDMPHLEPQQRALAINKLLSLVSPVLNNPIHSSAQRGSNVTWCLFQGQLDLLRNSSGLLYRLKDSQTAR